MHVLNIAIGSITWRLMFKDHGNAAIAAEKFQHHPDQSPIIEISDDFGQIFSANRHSIHGILLEDLEANKMAYAELLLQNERARMIALNLAKADPAMRQAVQPQGPAIINPMGNGRMPL